MWKPDITKDIYLCTRCEHRCEHVECGGYYYCPNCGPAKRDGCAPGFCYYEGGRGCVECGIAGRPLLTREELARRREEAESAINRMWAT